MRPTGHHPAIRMLHWLIAAIVIAALTMSLLVMPKLSNTDPAKVSALIRHMSAGCLVLLLASVRLFVRHKIQRPPALPSGMLWADRLASAMHPFLDGLLIIMIGSGIGMAVLSGLPAIVLSDQGHLPANFDSLPLHSVHATTARILVAALALHIVGALFHHFILKDGLLSRMWLAPGKPR